jgi:hypothetical protein
MTRSAWRLPFSGRNEAGMAIKYAGLRDKEVRVIGKSRSSLGEDDRIH